MMPETHLENKLWSSVKKVSTHLSKMGSETEGINPASSKKRESSFSKANFLSNESHLK